MLTITNTVFSLAGGPFRYICDSARYRLGIGIATAPYLALVCCATSFFCYLAEFLTVMQCPLQARHAHSGSPSVFLVVVACLCRIRLFFSSGCAQAPDDQ